MLDNKDASDLNLGQGANNSNSRVESIKVDIVRRSRLVEDEIDENGSFFNESLQSWKELNLQIVDILEKYLVDSNSLALDGLLDLVTKLAKDLEVIGVFIQQYGLPIQIPLSTNFT
ncbi:unnamed protein product [Absidia cylindrospora]